MKKESLAKELSSTTYPGRGIVIGKSKDGKKAVTAYFIMGRSENSRNRVFVEDGEGIRTQAFDPSKLEDPSLIIYAPVRVLGNKTIGAELTVSGITVKAAETDYTSKVAAMYDIIHEFYANAGFPFPEEALLAELDRMSEAQLFDTFLNTFYSNIA